VSQGDRRDDCALAWVVSWARVVVVVKCGFQYGPRFSMHLWMLVRVSCAELVGGGLNHGLRRAQGKKEAQRDIQGQFHAVCGSSTDGRIIQGR
jgi:hypothetical protein